MSQLLGHCSDSIRHFEGYRAQVMPDGFWVYYGYPAIQADGPQRAVSSSFAMLDTVNRFDELSQRYGTHRAAVRIGIHSGYACVTDLGGTDHLALGQVPIVAARLLGLAGDGTVVISEDTFRQLNGRFHGEVIGTIAVGDDQEPKRAYQVWPDASTHTVHVVQTAYGR